MIAKLLGLKTKKSLLIKLNEKQPLPMGRAAFEEWSDRIIEGALIDATSESQKFALADMLMHLGPTVAFECDGYFINCLRKFAVNQIADAMRKEIRDAAKARLLEESGEVLPVPQNQNETKVLAN